MTNLTRRGFVAGASAAVTVGLAQLGGTLANAADETASPKEGQLTVESLGNLIKAMGVETKLDQERYDFNFKTVYAGEEWELSMSAVLSQNKNSLWVMAWLDELPRSAADVPRTALLRLLANNDKMGNGKFFAYITTNRRFVLQRVIPNEKLNTAAIREALQDLGASVVETYPHWTVANWKATDVESRGDGNMPKNNEKSAPSHPLTETRRSPSKSANRAPSSKQ